ncbi:MAG: hypothetical protein WBH04_06635 [Albidovulum sp.]
MTGSQKPRYGIRPDSGAAQKIAHLREGSWILDKIQRGVIALIPVMALASPTLAAGKFTTPEGCTAYVTVQHSDCQVSQHYRCDADAAGDQWAVYADSEGPYYMSRIDAETRWMESHDLATGERDVLASETDPASFTTLLDTGRDDFDFTTSDRNGDVRRYVGYDQRTGESVTINGIRLERTRFDLSTYAGDGTYLHRRQGAQLINRDWRIFFADEEEFANALDERFNSTSTPVTFAQPGEPGFLETKPQFGCEMMMTEASRPFAPLPVSFADQQAQEAAQ